MRYLLPISDTVSAGVPTGTAAGGTVCHAQGSG